MFYIQESTCISSQSTFLNKINLLEYQVPEGNKFSVKEPSYEDIPEKILRRMGKAVRLGVGAAMPLIAGSGNPDGIIIGTANGGMEDCIKFLNQIIEYKEGLLTPTNFVQSTANAVAGQVGMLLKNNGYNITHVHRGHSFENAMLDAAMHLAQYPDARLLLGAVDEISAYNYNIDLLAGWYKTTAINPAEIYKSDKPGSYPGEGSAMFIVDNKKQQGSVRIDALKTITSNDPQLVRHRFHEFITLNNLQNDPPGLYLSGENGDSRMMHFYEACETQIEKVPVARFKHISGEFATASAIGLWLSAEILRSQEVPVHMWKHQQPNPMATQRHPLHKILIYNNHKALQHSFMLCSIDL
ncbi:beta-ketoacyl synthase chain length factor [Flavitalea sp.]|nr:beta-ketoacyl synthase chain length factor [Flavitalea sp.]